MPDITLGNYEIDEDGNGDLVIKDQSDTVVFKYDDTAGSFKPQVEFDFGSNDISNVGSLSTDEVVTEKIRDGDVDRGIAIQSVSIDDDSVETIDSEAYSTVFINSVSLGAVGNFQTGFDAIETVSQNGMSNEGNVVLSGTSGPDGSLNIAVDDNVLYLENRTGKTAEYTVVQMGV